MLSIYEVLIDEVVTKLRGTDLVPINFGALGIEVKKLPQYRGEFNELKVGQDGRIYVGFATQHFGTEKEPTNMLIGRADQESDVFITLSVASREQYGSKGALYISWLAQGLLLGFKPLIGGELSAFAIELVGFGEADDSRDKNAIWKYRVLMRVRDLPVEPIQDFRAEDTGSEVLLKSIGLNDDLIERKILFNVYPINVPENDVDSQLGID